MFGKIIRNFFDQAYIKKILAKFFSIAMVAYYDRRYEGYRKKYNIDQSFNFNGEGTIFYGDGKIHCGKNSYIGRYSSIHAGDDCRVFIGDDVAVSHFVMIYTSTKVARQKFWTEADIKKGDVIIGNNSWIGAGVFIKEGVTIGENSVVGANAVVTKNIPPNCVAGGVPAKVLYYKEDTKRDS
ncbi:MAG: acyltransferase [bacterium]|nr:acyltransferase [bacterium]